MLYKLLGNITFRFWEDEMRYWTRQIRPLQDEWNHLVTRELATRFEWGRDRRYRDRRRAISNDPAYKFYGDLMSCYHRLPKIPRTRNIYDI